MSKEYITPEQRYENEHSTGVIFTLMGLLGVIIVSLTYFDILPIPLSFFQIFVLFLIFFGFFLIGIVSFQKAKGIAATMKEENDQIASIRKWIADHCDSFCSDPEGIVGQDLYFQREEEIREQISCQYPELSEELLDLLVEETYQILFESDNM